MNNDYNNQQNQQADQQPYQQPPQQQYQQPYQQQYQQPYQQQYQQPYQYQQPNMQQAQLESKATQAMVFGIIGLFFAGIIFGILAINNANYCKKAGYTNGKVTAGFVLGIIDIALLALMVIIYIVAIGSLAAAM